MPTKEFQSKIPNLIIPGFDKCGTTTTAIMLAEHQEIALPLAECLCGDAIPTEPMFFLGNALTNCGDAYPGSSKYRIDATPFYYKRPGLLRRICRHSQNPKLIILMRDPVERAISYWNHFSPIVNNDPEREDAFGIRSGFTFSQQIDYELSGNPGFLIRDSMFYDRLNSLGSIFDPDQIHYGFMEEIRETPRKFFDGIFDFLEIDKITLKVETLNARERVFEPDKKGIRKLRTILYEQTTKLKKLTGRIPESWGKKTKYE